MRGANGATGVSAVAAVAEVTRPVGGCVTVHRLTLTAGRVRATVGRERLVTRTSVQVCVTRTSVQVRVNDNI